MIGTVTKVSENMAWVNFKYIGVYHMSISQQDKVRVGDVVLTSNIQGLEDHDEYVILKEVVIPRQDDDSIDDEYYEPNYYHEDQNRYREYDEAALDWAHEEDIDTVKCFGCGKEICCCYEKHGQEV